MKASVVVRQTVVRELDASRVRWAVVWQGTLPDEPKEPIDGADPVVAVFDEQAKARAWQAQHLPNAGTVVEIEPDNGLKPGVYNDRGTPVAPPQQTIPLVQRGLLFHGGVPGDLPRAAMGPINLGRTREVFMAQAEVTWFNMTVVNPIEKVTLVASGTTPAEAQNNLFRAVFARMDERDRGEG